MGPTEGSIWKAAGLRMAYVAQHAFHHLEKHMTKTPVQYIMWRFAGNDDQESVDFKTTALSVDEESARAQKWCIDTTSGDVRMCTSPKEDAFKATDQNTWVSKEILVKMGYLKLVQREDERQAAMQGLQDKQLTQPSIEKHLTDFGVTLSPA